MAGTAPGASLVLSCPGVRPAVGTQAPPGEGPGRGPERGGGCRSLAGVWRPFIDLLTHSADVPRTGYAACAAQSGTRRRAGRRASVPAERTGLRRRLTTRSAGTGARTRARHRQTGRAGPPSGGLCAEARESVGSAPRGGGNRAPVTEGVREPRGREVAGCRGRTAVRLLLKPTRAII